MSKIHIGMMKTYQVSKGNIHSCIEHSLIRIYHSLGNHLWYFYKICKISIPNLDTFIHHSLCILNILTIYGVEWFLSICGHKCKKLLIGNPHNQR